MSSKKKNKKTNKQQQSTPTAAPIPVEPEKEEVIEYVDYTDESMLPDIQVLVSKDLSEPYSVFTYRYFVHNWPNLCICVYSKNRKSGERKMIGTLVCKADAEFGYMAGYIAMLTVDSSFRHGGIGSSLVNKGIDRMVEMGCVEIILETEVTNTAALHLYSKLGFVKEERMSKYYLNGNDAYRLKLYIDIAQVDETFAKQNRVSPFPPAQISNPSFMLDSLKDSLLQVENKK